jgi:hypothetical protein
MSDLGKDFDKRGNRGNTDPDVQPLPERMTGRKVPPVEGSTLTDLVKHQFRLAQAKIAKPLLLTLICAFEAENVAIE